MASLDDSGPFVRDNEIDALIESVMELIEEGARDFMLEEYIEVLDGLSSNINTLQQAAYEDRQRKHDDKEG